MTSGQLPTAARLDDTDRSIVRLLQRNGRLAISEIAKRVNLSETTIRKRLSRLIGDELINIVAVPTPEAVGTTLSAIIGVSVHLPDLHRVAEEIVSMPEVRYVGLSTGRYDVIIEAFFLDQEHLLEFVSKRLGSLPGVTRIESSLILKVAKFSYEWELPLDDSTPG
jgi:Lrp/AsnC family transcriptional regulator for asnA, asnC and gidA